MLVFALNTGLRCGDIFQPALFSTCTRRKTHRVLTIPLNDKAYHVLDAWNTMQKGPYVFHNQMTWQTLRHTFASRLKRMKIGYDRYRRNG